MHRYLIIATVFAAAPCAAAPGGAPVTHPQQGSQQVADLRSVDLHPVGQHVSAPVKQALPAQSSPKWELSEKEKAEMRRQLYQFNRRGGK